MTFVGSTQTPQGGVSAPYTSGLTARTPYLTVAEYQAAPTAMDTSNLIEGGSAGQQTAALADTIARASSRADMFCCGAEGSLSATLNTETGRPVTDRAGRWLVKPRYWPVLEVRSFAVGSDPSSVVSVPLSPQTCWVEQHEFTVGGAYGLTTSQGPLQFGPVATPGSTGYAVWSYVNGWPNTALANAAAPAATSVTVANPLGIYPGTTLTIYDAASTETVTVAAGYTPGATVVPLVAPLVYGHASTTSVSALPPAVKQAVIFLTTSLIKSRGDEALILDGTGEPRSGTRPADAADIDEATAFELLTPFQQVWGQR